MKRDILNAFKRIYRDFGERLKKVAVAAAVAVFWVIGNQMIVVQTIHNQAFALNTIIHEL